MATLGIVFPGQGSQYVGMGRELFQQFEPARACFEEAQAVLGSDISRLCFEGPRELLDLTMNTQVATLTLEIAAWRVLVDSLHSLPNPENIELINIVGYLGDQIEHYIHQYYPHVVAHTVLQEDPLGQSHAIQLAGEYLTGPMLMVFADTLIETDLSFLANETAQAVAWVMPVPDPRRFGVAEVNQDGWVTQLIEKPQDMQNNLAVVGFYYFAEARDLLSAIEEQMRRGLALKGEYFLADAINIMLERGLQMRTHQV